MFSKKEIQIILVLSVIVLFVSGVIFAAHSHFSKEEPIATDDYSDINAVLAESGEDYGYVIEEGTVEESIEGVKEYQLFEKEYDLKDEILGGFVEQVTMQTYKIVKGDSIYSIAKKFSIREDVLKYNNPDLNKTLKIGQELKIYNGDYIEYKIGKGDTILAIANKFGVKVTDILRINSLQTSEIKPGNLIILKNPDLESYNDKIAQAKIDSGKLSKLPRNIGGGSIGKSQGGFAIRWPVRWAGINSGFGRRLHPVLKRYIYHQGVDTPVKYESAYAAADGVVSTAGTMSGYGLIIIIKHSNGYETRYAHLSKMSVRPGQKVKMGDYIGKTGATGRVTGPHLHFEVRKNGKALNPMSFR
jgi:murein DD-endopeptidase MepM/ murein hydrolase activator NlpD